MCIRFRLYVSCSYVGREQIAHNETESSTRKSKLDFGREIRGGINKDKPVYIFYRKIGLN